MTGFIFTSEKLGVFPNLDWEDYCPFADNKIPPAQGRKHETSQGGLGSACLVCNCESGPPVQPKNLLGIGGEGRRQGGCSEPHLLLGWAFPPLSACKRRAMLLPVGDRQAAWELIAPLSIDKHTPQPNGEKKKQNNPKLTVHSRSLRLRRP